MKLIQTSTPQKKQIYKLQPNKKLLRQHPHNLTGNPTYLYNQLANRSFIQPTGDQDHALVGTTALYFLGPKAFDQVTVRPDSQQVIWLCGLPVGYTRESDSQLVMHLKPTHIQIGYSQSDSQSGYVNGMVFQLVI